MKKRVFGIACLVTIVCIACITDCLLYDYRQERIYDALLLENIYPSDFRGRIRKLNKKKTEMIVEITSETPAPFKKGDSVLLVDYYSTYPGEFLLPEGMCPYYFEATVIKLDETKREMIAEITPDASAPFKKGDIVLFAD